MFDSVRGKLTLWYAGVVALSLVVFAFLVYYAAAAVFYKRQDESLRSTAQTVSSMFAEELEEERSVSKASRVVAETLIFPNRSVQIIDNNGQPIAQSKSFSSASIPSSTLSQVRQQGFSFISVNGVRLAVVRLSSNEEIGFAVVGEPLSVIEDGLRDLRRYFFAGVPLILLIASAGGYFLARKNLLPIASMNQQTQRISAENLSSRLDVNNPRDEVGQLAVTINDLLSRLEASFKEQQRFMADASHELRTPLAVLRGEAEIVLEKNRSNIEYQTSLSLIKDEAEQLTRIVENLFILARQPVDMPAGLLKEPVSVNDAIRDCARAARVLASRKGVTLKTNSDSSPIVVEGDEELLKRMILNLLDNAVKYTPAGGEISIELSRQNGSAKIVVADTGIGIPEADQLRVFDRFYRVDKARSRAVGGAGLGLSITRWIVDAHGGKIDVRSTPGRGSEFTVELPLDTL